MLLCNSRSTYMQLKGLPAKESVWIVPFLRWIEVEAVQPTLLRFGDIDRTIEALQQKCGAGDSHVGKQSIEQNRDVTKGSPEIGLWTALELPGCHLDKDDVRGLHFGKDAVADDLCSQRHEGHLARVAIVYVGGSDPGE